MVSIWFLRFFFFNWDSLVISPGIGSGVAGIKSLELLGFSPGSSLALEVNTGSIVPEPGLSTGPVDAGLFVVAGAVLYLEISMPLSQAK